MGFPYNDLIAPAILLDNPGITRKEFVRLLDRTHSSSYKEYKDDEDWNFYDIRFEDPGYHNGLEGLARILGLEVTSAYKEFVDPEKPKVDEYGLIIHPPRYINLSGASDNENLPYQVRIHKGNVVRKPERVTQYSADKLEKGAVWEETQIGFDRGIVVEILDEVRFKDAGGGPEYQYDMVIRPFRPVIKVRSYKTQERLWRFWPQFHPDNVFNWQQSEGNFKADTNRNSGFLWKKVNGKYYLDSRTFDRIPASFRSGSTFGYTDLLLTAEAVRHEAWRVLSRRGLFHFDAFLEAFPDTRARFEKGIWDSHTAIYAKMNSMSHFDLLRWRLGSRIKNGFNAS